MIRMTFQEVAYFNKIFGSKRVDRRNRPVLGGGGEGWLGLPLGQPFSVRTMVLFRFWWQRLKKGTPQLSDEARMKMKDN